MEENQKQSNTRVDDVLVEKMVFKQLAKVSLVAGILGIILSFFPLYKVWAVLVCLVNIIFSAFVMKKFEGKGMALAGLVLSIICILLLNKH